MVIGSMGSEKLHLIANFTGNKLVDDLPVLERVSHGDNSFRIRSGNVNVEVDIADVTARRNPSSYITIPFGRKVACHRG